MQIQNLISLDYWHEIILPVGVLSKLPYFFSLQVLSYVSHMDLWRTMLLFISLKSTKKVKGCLLKPINAIQEKNKRQNWIKIKNIQIQFLATFLTLHTNFKVFLILIHLHLTWLWLSLSRRGPTFAPFLVCMFYSGNTNQEHQQVKLMAGIPELRSCTIMKCFPQEILGNVIEGFCKPHAWMFVFFKSFFTIWQITGNFYTVKTHV